MDFDSTFDFSRGQPAAFTNAAGEPQVAAVDQPRFDHSPLGEPKGLAVVGRPVLAQPERITVKPGIVPAGGAIGVVLHEYQPRGGEIVRQAVLTTTPRETINALLNLDGWQRRITYLRPVPEMVDDHLVYHGQTYHLAGRLEASDGDLVLTGPGGNHLRIARTQ